MKRLSRFMFFVIVMWIITFPLPVTAQDVPSNQTVIMNYLNLVYNQEAIDAAIPLFSGDVVIHDPISTSQGLDGFVSNMHDSYVQVADLTVVPYALIEHEDMVVVPYLWTARTLTGSPTTSASGNGVEFFRVDNGKITEIWRHTEWHNFLIQGTSEDYRTQLNMVGSTVPMVEMSGIPMLTDALHTVTLVELTGEPNIPVELTDALHTVTLVELTGEPNIPANLLVSQTDETVVLRWLDSFNQGQISRELMLPNFQFHTCPCDDGIGTMDMSTFTDRFYSAGADAMIRPWTALVHEDGYTMVSEGGLTALLYDVHLDASGTPMDGVAIFRVENGLLAEAWQF